MTSRSKKIHNVRRDSSRRSFNSPAAQLIDQTSAELCFAVVSLCIQVHRARCTPNLRTNRVHVRVFVILSSKVSASHDKKRMALQSGVALALNIALSVFAQYINGHTFFVFLSLKSCVMSKYTRSSRESNLK